MTVKLYQSLGNVREELTSLSAPPPKRQKLYLDGLVKNGNFETDTDWALSTNWVISGGKLSAVNSADYTYAEQVLQTVEGNWYEATITCTEHVAASFRLYIHDGSSYQAYRNITSAGTYKVLWRAYTNNDRIRVYSYGSGGGVCSASFDNLTVREVERSVVPNSMFKADVYWTKSGSHTSISNGVARVGAATGNGSFRQPYVLSIGKTYYVELTVDAFDSGAVMWLNNSTGEGSSEAVINWGSVSSTGALYGSFVATGHTFNLVVGGGDTWVDISIVRVTEGTHPIIQRLPRNLEVSRVFIDGEIAREGDQYDYAIRSDGINQWLKPTVEPTATTETAVIGVYK